MAGGGAHGEFDRSVIGSDGPVASAESDVDLLNSGNNREEIFFLDGLSNNFLIGGSGLVEIVQGQDFLFFLIGKYNVFC